MTQQTVGPSLDTMLHVIEDRYRRRILVGLLEDTIQHTEDTLVLSEISDGSVSDVKIAMRHQHLPRLDETDFIEWDRDTNEVWKGPRFDEIRPLLELLSKHADELPDNWI